MENKECIMKTLFFVFIACFLSSFLYATIINVPADQTTIQAGITAAANTDTVLVQPGTYVENINYNGKLITVGSLFITTADTTYISSTIIDGNSSGQVVIFENGENSTAVLCGFTITNGSAFEGGGIYCSNSSPSLINLTVSGNGESFSSAFYCYFSNPNLENVTVSDNTGTGIKCVTSSPSLESVTVSGNGGSGIECSYGSNLILVNVVVSNNEAGGIGIVSSSNPTLLNVTITDNMATTRGTGIGGGIYLSGSCNPSLENVTITGNTATNHGGGIYLRDNCNPTFSNVTISGNTASVGGGIYCWSNCSPYFDTENRCNIYFNYAGWGNELYYTGYNIDVVVDTFTVIDPTDYYAQPLVNFTFDILHSKIEMVNSDLYVNPAGNDTNSGQSAVDPLGTIYFALSKILADSLNPHTIHLADGVYCPSTTGEHFPLNMVSYVSVSGESESGVILDVEGFVGGLAFHQDLGILIENLTITGGYSDFFTGFGGGGIVCIGSSPSFENVTVSGNSARNGGGIYCNASSPSLSNVTISGNTAFNGSGGGLNCYSDSYASLVNVTISGNSASLHGGGISCNYSSPSLEYVTISDNSTNHDGGGIWCNASSPSLQNVTITGNTASRDGGGIFCDYGSSPSLTNSILWNDLPEEIYIQSGSVTATYSDIQGGWTGTGNIEEDPLFVDPGYGDYHLQSTSPCIDTGDPALPLDPDGTIADMGAYYFHQTIPPDPPQNVTVEIIGTDVQLSWDAVTGATSYKVYSSDDPYTGFVEDTSGSFAGESWSAPIGDVKRFYHVIASTEIIRSKNSDSQDFYHPDRKSSRYESDKFLNRKRK